MPANLKIISVTRVRSRYILDGEQEYLSRLSFSAKISIIELDSAKGSSAPEAQLKKEHARDFLNSLAKNDFLILLQEDGKSLSSFEFAERLQTLFNQGNSSLVFGIGAPIGWDESVLARANLRLSLSNMTFPAHLARLMLIEQLYRAFSIMSGAPYHK